MKLSNKRRRKRLRRIRPVVKQGVADPWLPTRPERAGRKASRKPLGDGLTPEPYILRTLRQQRGIRLQGCSVHGLASRDGSPYLNPARIQSLFVTCSVTQNRKADNSNVILLPARATCFWCLKACDGSRRILQPISAERQDPFAARA